MTPDNIEEVKVAPGDLRAELISEIESLDERYYPLVLCYIGTLAKKGRKAAKTGKQR